MKNDVKKLTLSALFLALAFVMPFLTGQIPQIGAMLCPMHIPVILCGFFCGAPWGLCVGIASPILRSFIVGMPFLFPNACCMAIELGTYGFIAGLLYAKSPKGKVNVYVSLISAMIAGRLMWGGAMFLCMGLSNSAFGLKAFWAGAITNAIPGIIIQLILSPILVIHLDRKVKF